MRLKYRYSILILFWGNQLPILISAKRCIFVMRQLACLTLLFTLFLNTASAQDVDGSQDHPLITRYPGSVIQWYVVENYRPYKVALGPVTGYRAIDEWIETEGQVTRIYYALEGGERSFGEVWKNYRDALAAAGFEILADGMHNASSRSADVGSPRWQQVLFAENPFTQPGAVNAMVSGSSSSGGRGSIVATKERAAGTVYVLVSVYQFRDNTVSTLVDIVEVEAAETGLIVVDAEAIGAGIEENGRVVLDGVLFDYDKATLKAESKAALAEIAAYLAANSDKSFYVVGHTDSKGTFAYNQGLSADRARAVADALVTDYGVDRDRLQAHGAGPLVPVFSNTSDAGREQNRRVELVER